MNLKQKILQTLNSPDFPDLKLIYDDKSLDLALEILGEELQKEKKKFKDLLKIKNKDLTFDSFEDDEILDYYWMLLNHLAGVNSSEKIRKIIETFRPKLEDFGNEVAYSKPYFEKLIYINENLKLDEEQKRILHLRIKSFKDRGINLNEKKQNKLKEINKAIGKLGDKFDNNVVDSENLFEYLITDFEVIKDLPKEVLEIAKNSYKLKVEKENKTKQKYCETAKSKDCGHLIDPKTNLGGYNSDGEGYLFDSDPTSFGAIMKYCTSEKIRQDFEKSNYKRASSGKFDNRKVVLELLKFKRKKAKILGYKNYAELSLHSKMAENPKEVFKLLKNILKKAEKKAKKDLGELKKYFSLEKINSYDLPYYSRILKEKKYEVDEKELKKYFEFENVLSYLHKFVEDFYSVKMKEIKVNSYDENVKIYEVYREGKLISYYFLDTFYRKEKKPGAWANNLRQKTYLGQKKVPIIVNVCNFQKALKGKTTLYLRDVETIFHEFGHALHEMLSESKYSELSGFGVEWDFVELPSQLTENWVRERESLEKLAKHFETGKKIPKEILDKLYKVEKFMTGTFWIKQNELALLDLDVYTMKSPKTLAELDKKVLKIVNKYSLFKRNEDYKMYASFSHIFGGGYAAGYYSYMRAEILELDVFSKIKKLGMFDKKVGEKLFKTILGQGTRKKGKELFYDFMGREPKEEAFLEKYGL